MNYRMMMSVCALAAALASSGCVSQEQRELRRSYLAEFASYGLPRQLMSKIENSDPVSPADVVVLSRRGVPPGLIVSHIRRAPAEYRLGVSDIDALRAQSVSIRVIDAMLAASDVPVPEYHGSISFGVGGHF
jgi:hypothetical protein